MKRVYFNTVCPEEVIHGIATATCVEDYLRDKIAPYVYQAIESYDSMQETHMFRWGRELAFITLRRERAYECECRVNEMYKGYVIYMCILSKCYEPTTMYRLIYEPNSITMVLPPHHRVNRKHPAVEWE